MLLHENLRNGFMKLNLFTIVPQLDKCLKYMAFQRRGGGGEGGYFVLSTVICVPRIDLKFSHLASCDTIQISH